VEILSDSFEIDPAEIKAESSLYEELDLDSIDAIDIFVQLREVTGRRPDPAEARKIRTVQELVEFVEAEIAKGPEAEGGEGPPDPASILGNSASSSGSSEP
jgi:acyl carrier protein